ncbi:MAG: hypothetical protein MRY64_02400 [Hyphomonadaceae bacterium]|nr:hypothetical protein [Hyphomonadaceae bacterium]
MASLFVQIENALDLRRFEQALNCASHQATDMIQVRTTLTERGLQKAVQSQCHRALEALLHHYTGEASDV